MSTNQMYYYLSTKSMSPCGTSKSFDAEALGTLLCKKCKRPLRKIKSLDVVIQLFPENEALNIIAGAGVGIARRDFLEELGQGTPAPDLYLGNVVNEEGKEFDDFATFRGRRALIERGAKQAAYRTCPECRRNFYFAIDSMYLYPAPPDDADVFESGGCQLIVNEAVFSSLSKKCLRQVRVSKLKVLETPLDGFAELRSLYSDPII